MLKSRALFYSSPPKPAKEMGKKKTAKASTSSESEPDSLSFESSSEEAHPKNHMRTEDHKKIPPLECFPQSPLELTGTDHDKDKRKKGLGKKIVRYLFDKGGKTKEKKPQEENSQPITVEELIKSQHFYEATQHLIMQKKSNSNLDSRNDEKTLGNATEIEYLFELLQQEVLNTIESSISIAKAKPELLKNAVRAVVMWVEEEEGEEEERSIYSPFNIWKEEWTNTIQKSVEERMNAPPLLENKNLSTTGKNFLHMGKTMKNDMITVVRHIKHHYPEHFQVCNTYAKFYHHYFSSHLEMFAEFELSKDDNYLLLHWVQNLYPKDIKNNSVLVKELDEANLGNLLPLGKIKQLEQTYLTNEVDFIRCCLNKCLKIEVKSWTQVVAPRIMDDYYHSELSIDVIRAIHAVQTRAKDITPEVGHEMSALLLTEFLTFMQCYKSELEIFIKQNKQNKYFEAIIIANINNFENFRIHTEESTDSTESDVKTKIFSILDDLQTIGFYVFLEPLFSEIKALFGKFNERKWDSYGGIVDDVIKATDARIRVFKMLKNPHRQVIMEKIHLHLVQKYIRMLMWRKTTLKTPEKQNQLSEFILNHASILYRFCTENGSKATWLEFALPSMAEIIRLQDPDAIKIEVSALASRYPEVRRSPIAYLLYIKCLSYNNIESIVSVLNIPENAPLPPPSSLFAGVRVPFAR
ncbi:tumor necrosis factor alpha-induced protein 2 [Erythrolamprus reginae]|uniref:tumor necrosis factor alpha-induced protein 2 n=1 Tax=Erythrolamprus reginae TaxID=121349 RepID=UPI00396C30E8